MMLRHFNVESTCQTTSQKLKRDDVFTESSNISSDYDQPKKKRNRAKLDHLTPEQKKARRKEMNRRAAQTTRDRKRLTMEQLIEENRLKEIESARKDREIENLKSRIKILTASLPNPMIGLSSPQMIDSGISEDSSKTSAATTEVSDMDVIPPPPARSFLEQKHEKISPSHQLMNTSDSTKAATLSPVPDTYIDSMVSGEIDEEQCIEDILQLEKSVYSEFGNELFGSAASINVFPPRVQEIQYQSLSVENSAGWTSIQLMLLVLITKIHRLYSEKIGCCSLLCPNRTKIDQNNSCNTVFDYGNLYDYINNTSCCMSLRIAAHGIISNKNNIRQQRLIALEFISLYVYNQPTYMRFKANSKKIPFA